MAEEHHWKHPFILNAPWSKEADVKGVLKADLYLATHTALGEETKKKRDTLQASLDELAKSQDRKSPKIEVQ